MSAIAKTISNRPCVNHVLGVVPLANMYTLSSSYYNVASSHVFLFAKPYQHTLERGGGCLGPPTMLAILHVLLRQCLLLSHVFSTPLRTPLQYCKHLMYTLRVVAPPFHSNVAGKMSTYRHVTTPTKFVEVGVCLNCPRIHMRWLEHNKTGKLCTFPIVQLHRLWLWCTRVCKKCEPNG